MGRIKNGLSAVGLDPFVLGIVGMVFLGYFFPQLAVVQKPFSLSHFTDIGVGFIFFFYGLKLQLGDIRRDLRNWRLHLCIQAIIFIAFPLLILTVYPIFGEGAYEKWWLAFFFLAALPSTVSSSMVMVSIANGNIPSAIFNASISSLLGVFITPLWMGLFLNDVNGDVDLEGIFLKLFLQVLVPVTFGLLLNNRLGAYAQRNKQRLKWFDQLIILLIVYGAFSHSFSENLFAGMTWLELLVVTVLTVVLFFGVFFFCKWISRTMKLNKADETTLVFCGSKKSLVHGTVMSKVLFPNPQLAGFMLLPIMIYHASQLIIVSFIAKRWSKKNA